MNLAFTINEIDQIAEQALLTAGQRKVWALHGEMGSGKTTFVRSICKRLGVTDTTSSPTYSIINQYLLGSEVLYHIDLYRLKDEEEVLQAGVEDCFNSGAFCFIEWPGKAAHLLPPDTFNVILTTTGQNSTRRINFGS